MSGKKGIIFGVSNTHGIAYAIAQQLFNEGADIAFTFRIKDENSSWAKNNFLRYFKKIWVNVECFNVFSNKNVVSYFWVADYNNKYYGVPNYLTPFQLNAKLTIEF